MNPMTDTAERREERVSVGGDELTFRVASAKSDGALLAIDVRIPAGGGPPALHRHDAFELYRVERGELAFYLERDGAISRTTAGPGAVVAIEGGREHTIRNESNAEARAFVVFAPGGEIERFIRAAAELGRGGPPAMEDVLALAAQHGVELTRPLEGAR